MIGRQLLRSGTSVGANYRAACRGKSRADVIAKLSIVEEEVDECLYWMELLIGAGIMPAERLQDLMREGDEILAMTIASIKHFVKAIENLKSPIQNQTARSATTFLHRPAFRDRVRSQRCA